MNLPCRHTPRQALTVLTFLAITLAVLALWVKPAMNF